MSKKGVCKRESIENTTLADSTDELHEVIMTIETRKQKDVLRPLLIGFSTLMIAYNVFTSFDAKTLSLQVLIAMSSVFYCAMLLIACDAVPFLKTGGQS